MSLDIIINEQKLLSLNSYYTNYSINKLSRIYLKHFLSFRFFFKKLYMFNEILKKNMILTYCKMINHITVL